MGSRITQEDLDSLELAFENKNAYNILKIIFLFYFTIFILWYFNAYGTQNKIFQIVNILKMLKIP